MTAAGRDVFIALVGCGFVADYYMATLPAYPQLKVRGVYDRDAARLARFTAHHDLRPYASLEELLKDPVVDIVVNLTNPRSHYEISMQCIAAGKHVYSEKPLAMNLPDAQRIVDAAERAGVRVASAPCSVLGKAARTLSHAVKQKVCGDVRLVYAELDDGLVHKMAYRKWISESGAPWPYRDEFEVGCTLEHAGYYLAWLMEMFGPVVSVTAFSDCAIPDKVPGEPPLSPPDAADMSFGILKHESGVVARLSTTIVAPHDHHIRVFGDKGVVYLSDCWDNDSKVYFKRLLRVRRKTFFSPIPEPITLPYAVPVHKTNKGNTHMDFLLGIGEMAQAITRGTPAQLSAKFSLHVNEVALALQYAGTRGGTYVTTTRY